jgi:hypothetical protein
VETIKHDHKFTHKKFGTLKMFSAKTNLLTKWVFEKLISHGVSDIAGHWLAPAHKTVTWESLVVWYLFTSHFGL